MSQSPTPNIAYLDGWRGLAIVAVLIGHFILRPHFAWMGSFGVQLFFALSGYLMANLLFIKKVSMPDFFARRFARVIPTFVLFVTAMYVFAAVSQPIKYAVPAYELLSTLAFLRTYLPPGESIWAAHWYIGHIWSLNVEEHSYIYLAAGAVLTRGQYALNAARLFLIASVVIIISFCLYYPSSPPEGASPWFTRSECAALGLVAAAAIRVLRHATRVHIFEKVPRLLPVLWVVLACACISTYRHRGGAFIIAPLCLALAINYLDCVPELVKRILAHRILTWFGKCSFSIYLWQQPFFESAIEGRINPLLACLMAIGAGAVSYYAFENPVRLKINGAWANRRARGAALNTADRPA